jgi:hypothetical protein
MSLFNLDEEPEEPLPEADSRAVVLPSTPGPECVTPYLVNPPEPITIISKIWKGVSSPESIIKISRNGVIYDWAQKVEKMHGPDFFVRQPVSETKDFIEYKTALYTFTPAEFRAFITGLRAQWESERDEK